jgi:hypothetical protein
MDKLYEFLKELIKRAGALFLLLGVALFILWVVGRWPIAGAQAFDSNKMVILAIVAGIFIVAGGVLVFLDWRASNTLADRKPYIVSTQCDTLDQASIQQLSRSGLARAFRIKVDNSIRLERVCFLIDEETRKGNGHLRLTASSGHSYLHPMGAVWEKAKLGTLIADGKVHLTVVLESPFASFSETRALANNVLFHQWEDKQIIGHLVNLLQYPNVDLRVTAESITCSLFLTSKAVYYDPYLWAKPTPLERTENNFWVLEFDKVTDPHCLSLDCYGLLENHFEFLYKNSISLEQILHKPEIGNKVPTRERFYRLYIKDQKLALNNYTALTEEFHKHVSKRLKG